MLLTVLRVAAQQEVSFSHYWAMEPSFNPAAVGKAPQLNITGAYQMNMTGYEDHPRTMYMAADMPFRVLGAMHGVGIQLVNDELGLFTHKRITLQYALQHSLWGGRLHIGLQGGILNEGFKGSEIDVDNPDDPALATTDVNGTALDLGVGLYYQRGNWYAGLSVVHANAPSVAIGDRNTLEVKRAGYLTAGYRCQMRDTHLSLLPSLLAQTDGTTHRLDLTTRLQYVNDHKMLYGGIGYSPDNSVTVLIGGLFHGIHVGYSYEMFTGGVGLGNGSHELFVGYQTDINIGKKGRNRHQSVRIL